MFVSKDVARHFGFKSAEAALRGLYHRVRQGWVQNCLSLKAVRVCYLLNWLSSPLRAVLVCAWAAEGADALGPDGLIVHSDAFPPKALVDTLGAGDTFNAAVIYTLSNGEIFYCPSGQQWDIILSKSETLYCPSGQLWYIILSSCPTMQPYTVQQWDMILSNSETLYCPTLWRYIVQQWDIIPSNYPTMKLYTVRQCKIILSNCKVHYIRITNINQH